VTASVRKARDADGKQQTDQVALFDREPAFASAVSAAARQRFGDIGCGFDKHSPPAGVPLYRLGPRRYQSLPSDCPNCGADIRLLAFISEAAPIERILRPIGEPPEPPRIAPALVRPPGMTRSNRSRTGTRWRNPHRRLSSISASPG